MEVVRGRVVIAADPELLALEDVAVAKDGGRENDFSEFLNVRVLGLSDLFAAAEQYYLPWLQRAYAWQEEHATRLLTDMMLAFRSERQRYFLGYISIARQPADGFAAVIDGQQRLITLTMLFALLRDRISDPELRAEIDRCIWRPGPSDRRPLLVLQEHVQGFFERIVQEPGATELPSRRQANGTVAECEQNISNNLIALATHLDDIGLTSDDLAEFAVFAMTRCAVVVQVVADEDEAWQILATEEETGLGFHSSERSKVTLISAMPREQQEDAGQIWSDWQNRLGSERMSRLLSHLRVLAIGEHWRGRSNSPVETDLLRLYQLNGDGLAFIETVLRPNATSMAQIGERDFKRLAHADQLTVAVNRLEWVPFDTWMPAALAWAGAHGLESPQTPAFFHDLERLAWLMLIGGVDPVKRDRQFAKLATDVRQFATPTEMPELHIPDQLRLAALANLRSRTFYRKRYSALVLRRLCESLGNDPGLPDGNRVTCEHVLPLNPKDGSRWHDDFGPAGGPKQFCDRLGNIVLLSFDDNQKAATSEWVVKRHLLEHSGFALSRDAAQWPEWTPNTVLTRTDALVSILFSAWQLRVA